VAAGVTDFKVNAAKFSGDSLQVDVQVTASAQQGGLFLSAGAANIDLGTNSSLVLEVTGNKGSRELSFASGTALTTIAANINSFSDVTGVTATVSGTGIKLASNDFGSSQFVAVKVVDDGGFVGANAGIYALEADDWDAADTAASTAYSAAGNGVTDLGQDVGMTINGINATATGKTARINTDFLDVAITLNTATSQTLGVVGGATGAFTITGGGADFQLAGNVDVAGKVSLGIQDVAARKLGNTDVGYLDSLSSGSTSNVVDGNLEDAQKIVSEAIKQVSALRGRLGAFQKNTVGATIRSLNVQSENTAAAQSVIRDADFAAETAMMTRSQILVQASTNVLAMANSQPQSVLALLR
jgi:flagellin